MTATLRESVGAGSVPASRAPASYDAVPFMCLKYRTCFSVYDQLFSRFVGTVRVNVVGGVLKRLFGHPALANDGVILGSLVDPAEEPPIEHLEVAPAVKLEARKAGSRKVLAW